MLAAILRQNPRFLAGMTSPVVSMTLPLIPAMSPGSEYASFFDDDRRRIMIKAMFEAFYRKNQNAEVVFDTHRSWCGKMPLLGEVFPECKVICCVREPGWIIDSIERMQNRNPLMMSKLLDRKTASGTVYARVEAMMDSVTGFIGAPWSNLREAWYGEHAGRLAIVSYEGFIRNPRQALRTLYEVLNEPWFEHDLNNVHYENEKFDEDLGIPGLHTVRPNVSFEQRSPSLPPDIFVKYANSMFWKTDDEKRSNKPTIIC